MDQLRGYWFDSLTDSQSVPRLMITCISITSLTGYTVWFVSAAMYTVCLPQLKEFLALDDLIRPFFSFCWTCLQGRSTSGAMAKGKLFPNSLKDICKSHSEKQAQKATEITQESFKFKIWEDSSEDIGSDDWFSLVLLLYHHHECSYYLSINF